MSHKALVSSTNIQTHIDESSRCVPPAPPTHSSCPGLQSAPLALTLAPVEGLDLAVAMMEDPAGVQLSFHPALPAQAQGAAAAVASALLLL